MLRAIVHPKNTSPESHPMIHFPRGSAAPSRRGLKAALASLAAVLVATAALLVPATAASAAELPGAITSVTTDKTSYGYNDRIQLNFTWAVPDSAGAGDTFTLDLPDELQASSQAKFALRAPDGSTVANAVWAGKQVVFTLTSYADTHDAVGGSGFLTVQWDHAFTPVTSQPVVLQFDSNAVEVVIGDKPTPTPPCTTNCPPPPATPTSRSLSKSGGWADGGFEGTRDDADNINWTIALPGNPDGYAGPIAVVDTPAAGSEIDCATIAATTQNSLAGGTPKTALDPSRYTVDCTPSTFTLHLDAIAPSEFVTVTYKGTITDQVSGQYGNHVEVTIAGVTTMKDSTIKRTNQGGDGDGVQSVSVGDYVWLDSDHDGIQDAAEAGIPNVTLDLTGPDGKAVTSITGATVPPTTTDADGHYAFTGLPVLPAGQHYTVTIDQTASATALDGLVPTLAQAGSDRAQDSSTGSAESTDLTTNGAQDETLDFGFVLPDLPTLALPGGDDPQPTGDTLAFTGVTGVGPIAAGTLGLIVLGLLGVMIGRRRRA